MTTDGAVFSGAPGRTTTILTTLLISLLALPSLSEQQHHLHEEQSCNGAPAISSEDDIGRRICTRMSLESGLESPENDDTDKIARLLPLDQQPQLHLPEDFVDPCQDEYTQCYKWAVEGECRKNLHFTLWSCAKSCGICQSLPRVEGLVEEETSGAVICFDELAGNVCNKWAKMGECLINPTCKLVQSWLDFYPN